jgi:hypothetical protein
MWKSLVNRKFTIFTFSFQNFARLTMTINDPCSLPALADALLNRSGKTSLAVRFRALFALKSLAADGNNKAVEIIAQGTLSSCVWLTIRI